MSITSLNYNFQVGAIHKDELKHGRMITNQNSTFQNFFSRTFGDFSQAEGLYLLPWFGGERNLQAVTGGERRSYVESRNPVDHFRRIYMIEDNQKNLIHHLINKLYKMK